MPDRRHSATTLLAACAATCAVALATALFLQHAFGKPPCAWCVLQRLVFLVIAAVCVLGAFASRWRGAQIVAALATDALAGAGAVAALYLQLVASKSDSCAMTFADKVIMSLSLHETMPWMFFADAPCDEGNAPFLGVPFALWSLAGYLVVGVLAATALVRLLRGAR